MFRISQPSILVQKALFFYKIFKHQEPQYFFHLIPIRSASLTTRNMHNLTIFKSEYYFFKNSFFPSPISEWNKLNLSHRNSERSLTFTKNFKFIRPTANSVQNRHNSKEIKLIMRPRLAFIHLREHKFKHNFQEFLNPLCNCGHGIESTTYFFLHCPLFSNEICTLLSTLSGIDCI